MATLEELMAEYDALPAVASSTPEAMPISASVATPVATAMQPVTLGDVASSYMGGIGTGLSNLPGNLMAAGSMLRRAISPTPQEKLESLMEMQRAGPLNYTLDKLATGAEVIGRGAAQTAGAVGGAGLGMLTGPGAIVAVPAGAAAGAGAADAAFTSLLKAALGEAQPSIVDLAAQAGEATGGALPFEGAAAVLPRVISAAKPAAQRASELAGRFTEEGSLARVGELTQDIWNKQALEEGAKALKREQIPQTTGEVIGTKKAANLEKAITKVKRFEDEAQSLRLAAEEGNDFLLKETYASEKLLSNPEQLAPDEAGTLVRKHLESSNKARSDLISELYSDVDKTQTVTKYGSLKNNIQDAAKNLFGDKTLINDDLKSLMNVITDKGKKSFSVGELISFRAQAGDMKRAYTRAGNKTAAGLAKVIVQETQKLIERAPAGAKAWQKANKTAAPLFALEKEGALGGILDNPDLIDEKLISEVTKSKSAVTQYKQLVGGDPEAMAPVKAHYVNQMTDMTPAARAKFITKNKNALKEVFGDDYSTYDAMVRQQERYKDIARKGLGTREALTPELGDIVFGRETRNMNPLLRPLQKALDVVNIPRTMMQRGMQNALFKSAMYPEVALQASKLAEALQAQRAAAQVPTTLSIPGGYASGLAGMVSGVPAPAPTAMSGGMNVADRIEAKFAATDNIPMPVMAATPTPTPESKKKSMKVDISADEHIKTKPTIIQAIQKVESGGKDSAVSGKGARGRMQLMPATAKYLGVNIDDPIENIDGGEKFFNQMMDQFGDEKLALAAYNWGPGNLSKAIRRVKADGLSATWENILSAVRVPEETRKYVTKVLTINDKLKA